MVHFHDLQFNTHTSAFPIETNIEDVSINNNHCIIACIYTHTIILHYTETYTRST